jgi:mannosyltransferase OCH1-like enzyme
VANLRLLNPDFQYLFFDDKQVEHFIQTRFPQYKRVFDSFDYPIQRYDFFRYLVIYDEGGFYFDTDVLLACQLESLTHCDCVFPFEELTISKLFRDGLNMDWEIGNFAFGAEAKNPFLEAIIKNCIRSQEEPDWTAECLEEIPRMFQPQFTVLYSTGPGLITRTLAENPKLQSRVTILFPEDVCDESTWHCFGHYGVHLMQASWRQRHGLIRRRLSRFWENRRRRKLLQRSRVLGSTRQGSWNSIFPPATAQ